LHQHGTAVTISVQVATNELLHKSTQELGTNDALYVVDSCHGESDFPDQTEENKLENSCVDIESQDRELEGDTITLEVEVCEDTVISTASTLPVEPSDEVLNSSTLDVDVCIDDSTHVVADHEVSDVDTASYHSVDFGLEHLHESPWFQSPHHLVG
jgi:hypothetical protein